MIPLFTRFLRVVAALALLVACGRSPKRAEVPPLTGDRWCMMLSFRHGPGLLLWQGCTDTRQRCEVGRRLWLEHGHFARVHSVSECARYGEVVAEGSP